MTLCRLKLRRLRYLFFAVAWLPFPGGNASAMDADLGQFLYDKQQQIDNFSATITNQLPRIIWRFYDAARREDWDTASNVFNQINAASRRYAQGTNDEAVTPVLGTFIWPPLSESYGACEQFHLWNNRWLHRYGREIIGSIPPGSIYFGGTDPGRFVISALCESQVEGKPFFTLTQNQLADPAYLDYLRAMYGRKIKIPTVEDVQNAFQDYTADAARRREAGRLKPGEDVKMVDGRVQVSGQVAVMEINGLLAKKIFEENSSRQFYVEESYPLDWMYPYLTPHGLFMQLNNKPLAEITDAEMLKDREYWKKLSDEILGNWLDEKTPVQNVCDFAVKYGLGEQLADYPGDQDFAANDQVRKCYSKLRTSLGGLYAWRAQTATDPDKRKRMYDEADYAFRQGFAICPYSPEALYGYINLLLARQRTSDAILIAKTTLRLTPNDAQLRDTLAQLEKYH
jgi:hypothetical protein